MAPWTQPLTEAAESIDGAATYLDGMDDEGLAQISREDWLEVPQGIFRVEEALSRLRLALAVGQEARRGLA